MRCRHAAQDPDELGITHLVEHIMGVLMRWSIASWCSITRKISEGLPIAVAERSAGIGSLSRKQMRTIPRLRPAKTCAWQGTIMPI